VFVVCRNGLSLRKHQAGCLGCPFLGRSATCRPPSSNHAAVAHLNKEEVSGDYAHSERAATLIRDG
jgi:hypothetical protein